LYGPYSETCHIDRPTADRTKASVGRDNLELLKLLNSSTTHSTKRAYDSDLRHFVAYGCSLPATNLDVARYVAAHASNLSMATLVRRLVAIGQAHTVRGLADPTKTDLVRRAMRGVRRMYGAPQQR
jgi:hypothetical protein